MQDKILAKSVVDLIAILDRNKGIDSLAGELIRNTDDGCFSYCMVLNEGSLNLGGGETVTGNVDNIVNTTADPVITLVVTRSSVTSELPSRQLFSSPMSLHGQKLT